LGATNADPLQRLGLGAANADDEEEPDDDPLQGLGLGAANADDEEEPDADPL
ncbi:hypothetical protein A2U01_0099597, partial [Trifolium medium]|nr:hypothetical protein [Trifolium medium]